MFKPEFDLLKFLKGAPDLVLVDEDMGNSVLNELKIYVLAAMICILVLLILITLRFKQKLKQRIN